MVTPGEIDPPYKLSEPIRLPVPEEDMGVDRDPTTATPRRIGGGMGWNGLRKKLYVRGTITAASCSRISSGMAAAFRVARSKNTSTVSCVALRMPVPALVMR